MLQTFVQYYGSITYIGLAGSHKPQMVREHWSYSNHKFSRELHWTQDNSAPFFCYFLDLSTKLLPALQSKDLFRMLQKLDTLNNRRLGDSEINESLLEMARLNASWTLNNFIPLTFIGKSLCRKDYYETNFAQVFCPNQQV